MRKSRILLVAAAILASAFWFGLPAQQSASPSQAEREKAVQAVRMINTAEVVYMAGSKGASIDARGRFGSLEDLIETGTLKAVAGEHASWNGLQFSESPEIFPGWHLDLIVPADGKSWSVALHDKREGDGLFSVFSDSTGIIYLGAPMP